MRLPAVLLFSMLLAAAWPFQPAAAESTTTESYAGVLGGGGLGLHVMEPAAWRADHPVDVSPGVVGVSAHLEADDPLEADLGSDWWIAFLDPHGEPISRTVGGFGPTRDLTLSWREIERHGFGSYELRVECGFCSAMTYNLEVTTRHAETGANLTIEDQHVYAVPGKKLDAPWTVLNTGLASIDTTIEYEGLPAGWGPASREVDTLSPGEAEADDLGILVPEDVAPGTTVTFDAVLRDDDTGAELDRVAMEASYSHDVARLMDESLVVVALIDTGINPYHVEFRGPHSGAAHPAYYVDAYPEDAQALPLSLDAADYASAKSADAAVWAATKSDTLYYVPGTRVIGMYCAGLAPCLPDEGGHGTGTASLAVGTTTGEAPDALVVAVTGDIFAGARWAARQPWIDVISMSLGPYVGTNVVGINEPAHVGTGNAYVPFSVYGAQETAYESGKRWFTASSQGWNAYVNQAPVPPGVGASGPCPYTFGNSFAGSPWTFNVETYWPWTELPWFKSCTPDLVAKGWDLVAASPSSLTGHNGFGHPSGATPQGAGAYARLVQEARRWACSTQEGPRPVPVVEGAPNVLGDGVLALDRCPFDRPTPPGPLSDGVFTVREAERVLLHSLEQVDTVESYLRHGSDERWMRDMTVVLPGAEYASEGYGLLTPDARADALAILRGEMPEPLRPDDDAAYAAQWAARLAFWEPHARAEVWVF